MNEKQVDELVEKLFRNAFGEQADRLVLMTADGKDLGGWCKKAIKDRILAAEKHQ